MSWNHRVLKRIHKEDGKEDDITYWICEAAYKDGVETDAPGHTLGIPAMSEDLSGLRSVLEQMLRAVDDVVDGTKNVIEYEAETIHLQHQDDTQGKPGKIVTSHYDYRALIKFIEEKYDVKTRDYYGAFGGKSARPWDGPRKRDHAGELRPPYADFWHWFISINDHITNGCYAYFPEDWRDLTVQDEPKCYNDNAETIPTFVTEILEMIEQELGDDMYSERFWVDW